MNFGDLMRMRDEVQRLYLEAVEKHQRAVEAERPVDVREHVSEFRPAIITDAAGHTNLSPDRSTSVFMIYVLPASSVITPADGDGKSDAVLT